MSAKNRQECITTLREVTMKKVAADQRIGKHVFHKPFHDLTHLTSSTEVSQHSARDSWVDIVSLARLSQGQRKWCHSEEKTHNL